MVKILNSILVIKVFSRTNPCGNFDSKSKTENLISLPRKTKNDDFSETVFFCIGCIEKVQVERLPEPTKH